MQTAVWLRRFLRCPTSAPALTLGVIAAMLAVSAPGDPARAQFGGGARPSIDILRIDGVFRSSPLGGALLQLTLVVGGTKLPMQVTEVRQANGPGEGRYLLSGRLGEIDPTVRVVGDAGLIAKLNGVPAGVPLEILGQLAAGDKEMLLLSVEVNADATPIPAPSVTVSPAGSP